MANAPGSPKRPSSAISIISDDSDHDKPTGQKIKVDDDDDKTNVKPGLLAPSATDRLPAANLPAAKYADSAQPVRANGKAPPAPNKTNLGTSGATNGPGFAPPPKSDLENWLNRIMSYGLEYMNELRRNTNLRLDVNLRNLLLDPLPDEAKPLKVANPHNIPVRLYEYFHLLTFHTNKILGVAVIWLDLFTQCDIYISYPAICAISERLFKDGRSGFGWIHGVQLENQTPAVQHYVLGLMASTKMLHAWSKSHQGMFHRRSMELAVDGKWTEKYDPDPADKVLEHCHYDSWKDFLGLDDGLWVWMLDQSNQ